MFKNNKLALSPIQYACLVAAGLNLSASASNASSIDAFFESFVHDVSSGSAYAAPPLGDPIPTLSRIAPAHYADDEGELIDRGSPRVISNAVSRPEYAVADEAEPLTNLAVAMLQLLASHEIASSPTGAEVINIAVPEDDPVASLVAGETVMVQDRSLAVGPVRQQENKVTPLFDGSTVYGSDEATTDLLRENDGTGRMKIGANDTLPIIAGSPIAGDERASENPNLQAVHRLFLAEHNRLADHIAEQCVSEGVTCSGDQIFEGARTLVAATQEKIFYDELLPIFLNTDDLHSLLPDPSILGTVSGAINEFTAGAGRIGHTKVPDTIKLQLPGETARDLPLAGCFFDADCLGDTTLAEQLYGLSQQETEPVDTVVNDTLRNAVVPAPHASFLIDLFSTNINRGRDHGIPDYMALRSALGFADAAIESLLPDYVLDAYPDYLTTGVDAIVGIFAEVRDPGNYLGDTARAMWALQFLTLQNEHSFLTPGSSLESYLDTVSMAGVISNNTWLEISDLPSVFVVPAAPTNVPLPAGSLLLASGFGVLLARRRKG